MCMRSNGNTILLVLSRKFEPIARFTNIRRTFFSLFLRRPTPTNNWVRLKKKKNTKKIERILQEEERLLRIVPPVWVGVALTVFRPENNIMSRAQNFWLGSIFFTETARNS